ncbi:MAG: hypothetical protein RL169_735, partial [Armatimonadota bacterium]
MRNVISPLDGTVLASVRVSTATMLDQQLDIAAKAFVELGNQPRYQRIAWLRALHSGLLGDLDGLTYIMA